ncbi:multidrug resistance-associated ABC transporter [Infundibulicybe gibba]|nr:multidrug resistance-associated ABC transporter [Infundibulicybe gibba]
MKFYNPFNPPPAPPAFGKGRVVPESTAPWLSKLVFEWMNPLLGVGFSRPLENDDLWELPPPRLTSTVTNKVESNFYLRCPPESRPYFLEGELNKVSAAEDKENKEKYDSSLFLAIYQSFRFRIWLSGIFKLISDILTTTTPLLNRVILTWLTDSYIYSRLSDDQRAAGVIPKPKGIGYGIGLAFALFAMQETASLMTNHYMQSIPSNLMFWTILTKVLASMSVGLSTRAAIIGNIFRKSLRLSGRAKLTHSFCMLGHGLWILPIQFAIGLGLLIHTLGYSALVGLGVLLFGFPIQALLVGVMFNQRKKGVGITDTRVRLTTEVLQGIRLIKFYAWEEFYASRIGKLREQEIATIRKSTIAQSGLIATVTFTPVLASVLSFITYAVTGHDLTVAVVFTSLQFFNIIRIPLIFFPFVLSSLSEALVALARIGKFLTAEELANPYLIDYESKSAIEVDGAFTWEAEEESQEPKVSKEVEAEKQGKDGGALVLPISVTDSGDEKGESDATTSETKTKPFELNDLQFSVERGAFVAIVGGVGSGKSSVLQALIGEMRRTQGTVVFGGTVAYVPQTPWIRNATVRENILFGQADDEEKFRKVIQACSLEHDLGLLPHGENTEIGEKGINLSGGQKARVSMGRAAYSEADIVLLDDPLSAVDAHVGRAILEECLLSGPLANRTRILVTHALHVLDKTDYIYVMDGGVIIERGTYESLMKDETAEGEGVKSQVKGNTSDIGGTSDAAQANAPLMQAEERNVGSVTWDTYKRYLQFAGGVFWAFIILILLAASEASSVWNNIFLGFWTADTIPGFRQGDYIAVYAALGVAQALFSFVLSFIFIAVGLTASLRLFKVALSSVLHSPTSFFDTTPIGRILSRLSKDQDTLDAEVATTLYQFFVIFSAVLGTVALVFYTFPLLGIIFAPMAILYGLISIYYRRTSVETKRLDSLMRSAMYSSYSETLTGLSTIRVYRQQDRSVTSAEHGLDMENRAYYMTISLQRWLSVRLDLFGNVLIFGIALFAAGFRHSVNPAKVGVVLTYTLTITQVFSEMVSQYAQNEQNMNAVERVLHYSELPSEGDSKTPNDPPTSWPAKGEIAFTNVGLAYREGLPLVLKGVSFRVNPGEKVGIVGRTGAGKSSLLQALFRTVELQSGKIEIDGYDIHQIGLDVLRSRLALVPQDSTLFLGTLRENLDPRGTCTDAELIYVLQRAWLLPREGPVDPVSEAKFSLDSAVVDEGSNYSAGEKQLLALCRALVKNSRIIVLDEATSSVDVETDAKLQRTIQTEFATSTLLCIAHRLNTIAYYDRVIVMDAGNIVEFDTVLNLFDKEDSIFRSLCNEANLQRSDILRIRADHDNTIHRE